MSTRTHPPGPAGLAADDAGAGPPLVLVHAFPLSRAMWARQVAGLSDRYRVIAPDVFGFGGSPLPPGGWTVDAMADALAEFLTERGVTDPVVLGGLSMGGYVALAFARRHPDRLRGLILADTKAEPDTPEAKVGRDKTIALAREQGAAAVVEQMLPKVLGDTTRASRPAVVAAVRALGAAQSVGGLVAGLTALRDRPDATPGLAAVRVPTLVIVGAEDAVTPPAAAEKLAAAIPGARLVELPAAGHLTSLEDPEQFDAVVQAILNNL